MKEPFSVEKASIAYEIAREVYRSAKKRSEAAREIVAKTGTSERTANGCIELFKAMMNGTSYTTDSSESTTRCFLDLVRRDYGDEAVRKALVGIMLHAEYMREKSGASQLRYERIYRDFGKDSTDP